MQQRKFIMFEGQKLNTDEASVDCRNLVRVIEELLERRKKEMLEGSVKFHLWRRDDWRREWTSSELCDTVYSSYQALRRGIIKRPPAPSTVMEIADYLECNLEERNRLLVAARYAPVPLYLQGEALETALNIGRDIAKYVPLPSYIINRDWNVLFLNDHVLKLISSDADTVLNIEPKRLNVLHLLVDPELPLHMMFSHDPKGLKRIIQQNVHGFKVANVLSQHEKWFTALVEEMMQLPNFKTYWDEVQIDWTMKSEMNPPYYTIEMRTPNGKLARFRSLSTSFGNYDYPQIVSYVPIDNESQAVFTDLGIPTPANRWSTE